MLPEHSISIVLLMCLWPLCQLQRSTTPSVIEPTDVKALKHLLKVTPNLLCVFVSSGGGGGGGSTAVSAEIRQLRHLISEAADQVKGVASVVYVDCETSDGRKMCRKFKANAEPYELKHFKDGVFHKNYDRRLSVSSLVNFLRDPTGDTPWEEDPTANHVRHVANEQELRQLLKRSAASHAVMLLLYVPWCGFCRQLKPVYAQLATDLAERSYEVRHIRHTILAAIDLQRAGNSALSQTYDVTGYPTIIYFVDGKVKYRYQHGYTRDALLQFLADPSESPPADAGKTPDETEPDWADQASDVVHLSGSNFDQLILSNPSVLVMFYAPWCGYCKKMKPHYESAASQLKQSGINAVLAAVDATKHKTLASLHKIEGYPTLKYFSSGAAVPYAVTARDSKQLVEFMKDPREPPPPPAAELPWHETAASSHVHHIVDEEGDGGAALRTFLKRKKHALVIFYAPWCGHCKRVRPEFEAAADTLADNMRVALVAVDCTVQKDACKAHDVTGYPTIVYFSYYKTRRPYDGVRTHSGFVSFIQDMSGEKSKMKDEL